MEGAIERGAAVTRNALGRRAWRVAAVAALPLSLLVTATGFAHEPIWCEKARTVKRAAGVARVAIPALVRLRRGILPLAPSPLRARAGNLRRENAAATRDNLSRLRSHRTLARFRRARLIVALPASTRAYDVVGVPASLRVARPWTKRFIEQLAAAKHLLFGTRLRITSLTRTTARQEALIAANVNAAPVRGPMRSTHLTGGAVDISKRQLSELEINWLRTVLQRLTADALVHAIEEFNEPHFHVLVRRRYGAYSRTLASPLLIGGC